MKHQSTKNQPKNSPLRFSARVIRFLASNLFFWIIIGVFLAQAVWIAFTAVYPMAFDENFHFGIIKLYAEQWSPFLTKQPANPGPLGIVVHDPSYLYHYLMSFPYRLCNAITHNQIADIIVLRLINVAFFGFGLWLFRKLLPKFGISLAMTNVALLITILIPIVPFLAGQINYDNLVVVLVPLIMLLSVRIIHSITSTQTVHFSDFGLIFIVALLGSLVKYPFMPIAAACAIVMLVVWLIRKDRGAIWRSLGKTFLALSRTKQIVLIAGMVISLGLFAQRDLYNIAVYHSVTPDCSKVLTVEQCKSYGPWGRDYIYQKDIAEHHIHVDPNPFRYLGGWVYGMVHRLYFTINSNYENYSGLPLPTITGVVVCSFGFAMMLVFAKRIFRRTTYLWLPVSAIALYIFVLIADNYLEYLHTNIFVAINGRYLLIFMPLLIAFIGLGISAFIGAITKKYQQDVKTWLIIAIVLLTLDGGGALSFLYYAAPKTWYWPHNPLTGFNEWVRGIIKPLILR